MNKSAHFIGIAYTTKAIDWLNNHCAHLVYILHDKDTNTDGTLKSPHYHFCVELENRSSTSAFLTRYNRTAREDCQNIRLQLMKHADGCISYLTHKDNQDKYPYPITDIKGDIAYWSKNLSEIQDSIDARDLDWTVKVFTTLLDYGYLSREDYITFVREYGRDFIFNIGRVYAAFDLYTSHTISTLEKDGKKIDKIC